MTSITNIFTDSTTLLLHSQSAFSGSTSGIKTLVVVGNYVPTGLNYENFTNLTTLRMFDGEMTSVVRTQVQNLAKNTNVLQYLEIQRWGTAIEDNAFQGATSLKEVKGFEDVRSLGQYAFYNCNQIAELNFPNVTAINSYTFAYCSALSSLLIPKLETITGGYSFLRCGNLTSLSFPNATSVSGDHCFEFCAKLTLLELPNANMTSISGYFLASSSAFGTLVIKNELVTSIGRTAFYYNGGIPSISFPNLTSTSYDVFTGCSRMTSAYLPKLTNVRENNFSGCSRLTELTISDQLSSVGSSAFSSVPLSTLNLIGHNTAGNGISSSCSALTGKGLGTTIRTFNFILGPELISQTNIVSYINNILSLTRAEISLLSGVTSGTLDLQNASVNISGLTAYASGRLIDTIKAGATSYVWNGSTWA
jgi:hypothetical protein